MQASSPQNCGATASALNEACFCISLDQSALADTMSDQLGNPELKELLNARCPRIRRTTGLCLPPPTESGGRGYPGYRTNCHAADLAGACTRFSAGDYTAPASRRARRVPWLRLSP